MADHAPRLAVNVPFVVAGAAVVVLSALAAGLAAAALVLGRHVRTKGGGGGRSGGSSRSGRGDQPARARWLGWNRASRPRVLHEFPYAVELLALCCLSGMNLSQAIETVGRSGPGYVQKAFALAGQDFSAGFARGEALSRLAARLGTSSARSLVSAIKQSEMSGTPIVEILRTHAEAARREQHAARLKQAELMPLKLAVCTVVFLLPALIIVSVTPHVLAFIKSGW